MANEPKLDGINIQAQKSTLIGINIRADKGARFLGFNVGLVPVTGIRSTSVFKSTTNIKS